MSEWHRDNPELIGTPADPWYQHDSYRHALEQVRNESGDYCRSCGEFLQNHERGICDMCRATA